MTSLLTVIRRAGLVLVLLTCTMCASLRAEAEVQRAIPDYATYGDFLIGDYDIGKPTLVAFKDPRCPYCINALKTIYRLSNYNVYLFWSPILGPRSLRDVNLFFYCDSPSGGAVIEAVKQRRAPECSGQFNHRLARLNDEFVTQYNPTSVPQYWFGGQRVGMGQLRLSVSRGQQVERIAESSSLKIPWHRYPSAAIGTPFKDRYNVAIVLNNPLNDSMKKALLNATQFNWYVFDSHASKASENMEFRVLTNTLAPRDTVFMLEGKALTKKEREQLLPAAVLSLISTTAVPQVPSPATD